MSFYTIFVPRPKSEMFLPGNVNLEQMVTVALWNVDYHLRAVHHFNGRPGMSTIWKDDPTVEDARKPDLQADINRFHAHLRSFFWELVATFDAMKVWIVETYGRNSEQMAELEKTGKTDWYVAVSAYRNFAHRSFLFSQGVFGENRKLIVRSLIQSRRDGGQPMIPHTLVEYRNEMQNLFDRIRKIPVAPVAPTAEAHSENVD
jgi:hypothetical protein